MPSVVCTAHDAAYQELADVTRPSLERYCQRNGYRFAYQPDIDPAEKDACKARIFLQLYESGEYAPKDLFLWVDTDALIMNSSIPLETIAIDGGLSGSASFLWAFDWNGPNSGVWLARFDSRAAHFVRTYNYLAHAMGWG